MKVRTAPNKNADGRLGKVCNNCGGFGFTLHLTQGSAGCMYCGQTGVAQPTNAELASEITRLSSLLGVSPLTQSMRSIKNSRQFWVEMIAWATSTATAVANTATETILFPNTTIPANYMQDGRALRLKAMGSYGTTATPTLVFSVRWGGVAGTVLAKQAANVTTSGTGGGASMTALWEGEVMLQTRSNGSAGTLMTNGTTTLFTSTLLTAGTVTNYGQTAPIASGSTGGTTPVAVTADLTADTALSLTATWGTSNAANSIQGMNYEIDSKN